MDAVVLACAPGAPEALALRPVHGRPFLWYQLEALDRLGVAQSMLCVPQESAVAGVFGSRYRNMKLRYCPEPEEDAGNPLALRLRRIFALCEGQPVLALKGWVCFDGDLESFVSQGHGREADAMLALVQDASDPARLANAGACWVNKASPQSAKLAARLLAELDPDAVAQNECCVIKDALTVHAQDATRAEAVLKTRSLKDKAVFLDRDGTINIDKNYLYKPEDLEFIEGMPAFIALWRRWGYRIIVVTNQSGIARGYYSEKDMERLHACLNERLERAGAHVDAFYHCPHHPDFNDPCSCRKPASGLIEKAIFDYNLDPAQCLLFGDKSSDIRAGQSCDVFSVKVR